MLSFMTAADALTVCVVCAVLSHLHFAQHVDRLTFYSQAGNMLHGCFFVF